MSSPAISVELHGYLEAADLVEEIRVAEQQGYAGVWLGDSQLLWREIYVLLGAAAVSTTSIGLGLGVTNPVSRHLTVTSAAIRTLQELAGPRVNVGIGVGYSAVRLLGKRPATRAYMREFVPAMKRLVAGEKVTWEDTEVHLAWAGEAPTSPVYIGASGPKMLRLAGQIGDGVIIGAAILTRERLEEYISHVQAGREDSGRSGEPFRFILAPPAAVSEDRDGALAAVRPHVARSLLNSFWEFSPAAERAKEQMLEVYNQHQHMVPGSRHADAIPLEVIPEFAIAGTPEECRDKLAMIFDCGIDEITIRPYGVAGSSRAETLQSLSEKVVQPFQQQYAPSR